MLAILVFFVAHWLLSVFFQTFFLHRYGAHRMFTMSKGWERFFYVCTALTQGSSFLVPRGYAILHREHHAFSDTERDPHSPHMHPDVARMMWHTKDRYSNLVYRRIEPEARFDGGYPEWYRLDRFFDCWPTRIAIGTLYTLFYMHFAPSAWWYLLLPAHYFMGPLHGAIVNWAGHKYGYRNFDTGGHDRSRNTLVFDFLTMGELFQNNHHTFGMSPNFAARWFEIDPSWAIIRLFDALGMIKLPARPQRMRWPANASAGAAVDAAPAE